jgi:hypothetical protein
MISATGNEPGARWPWRRLRAVDCVQSKTPAQCAGAVERGSISRACNAIAINAEPPNTKLMPTSSASTQAAVHCRDGRDDNEHDGRADEVAPQFACKLCLLSVDHGMPCDLRYLSN